MGSIFTEKELGFDLQDHQRKIYDDLANILQKDGYEPSRVGLYLATGAGKTYLTKRICNLYGRTKKDVLIISPKNAVVGGIWEGMHNINYEKVTSFFGYNGSFYKSMEAFFSKVGIDINNLCIVFDEAHNLKNLDANKRSLCKLLFPIAKQMLFLTGTPFGSGDYDLYKLSNLIYNPRDAEYKKSNNPWIFYDVIPKDPEIYEAVKVSCKQMISETSETIKNKNKNNYFKHYQSPIRLKGGVYYLIEDNEMRKHKHNSSTYSNFIKNNFIVGESSHNEHVEAVRGLKQGSETIYKAIDANLFCYRTNELQVGYDYENVEEKTIQINQVKFSPREYRDYLKLEKDDKKISKTGDAFYNYSYLDHKMFELDKIIEKHSSDNIIIWDHYRLTKKELVEKYKEHGVGDAFIDQDVNDFQNGKLKGLIASPLAHGEAFNWIMASVNVYMNPSNFGNKYIQSRARTNRQGQTLKVYYYYIVLPQEVSLVNNLKAKHRLNKTLF